MQEDFKEALARWASGVTIVATEHGGQRHGLTASSFTSVSLSPPLVLVCVDRRAESFEALRTAPHFAISVLAASQQDEALRMARPGPGKFDGMPFVAGEATGQPVLPGALAQLECRLFRADEAGDHLLVLGEVLAARVSDGAPLLYFHRRFRELA